MPIANSNFATRWLQGAACSAAGPRIMADLAAYFVGPRCFADYRFRPPSASERMCMFWWSRPVAQPCWFGFFRI